MIAIYVRGSTSKQIHTIDQQTDAGLAYVQMRKMKDVEVVTDIAITTKIPFVEREGGAYIQGQVESGKCTAIICSSYDRCFRNAIEAMQMVKAWSESGVAFHMTNMGGNVIDCSTPHGEMIFGMLMLGAQCERALIAERTKASHEHGQKNGRRVTRRGYQRYGYRYHDELCEECEGRNDNCVYCKGKGYRPKISDSRREEAVIRQMVVEYQKGATPVEIGHILTSRGVYPRGGKSKAWSHSLIRNVLIRLGEITVGRSQEGSPEESPRTHPQ